MDLQPELKAAHDIPYTGISCVHYIYVSYILITVGGNMCIYNSNNIDVTNQDTCDMPLLKLALCFPANLEDIGVKSFILRREVQYVGMKAH